MVTWLHQIMHMSASAVGGRHPGPPPEYVHDFLGKIADKYNLLLKKHLNKDNKTI